MRSGVFEPPLIPKFYALRRVVCSPENGRIFREFAVPREWGGLSQLFHVFATHFCGEADRAEVRATHGAEFGAML